MKKKIEIIREKLSKKFLFSLLGGVMVTSNCGYTPYEPIFMEKMVQVTERASQ